MDLHGMLNPSTPADTSASVDPPSSLGTPGAPASSPAQVPPPLSFVPSAPTEFPAPVESPMSAESPTAVDPLEQVESPVPVDPSALNPQLLIQQLKALVEDPNAFRTYKTEIVQLSRKASVAFENAYQTHHRISHGALPLIVGRIGQEKGLFRLLVDNTDDDQSTSTATISDNTGIKTDSLHTLLSYMTAQDMIEEVKASHYRANTITKNLVHPLATSGFPLFQDALLPAYLGLHDAANCARVAPFMGDPGFKIGHGKVFQEWERLPENANTVNNLRKFLEARSLFISSYQTDKSVIGEHVRLGDNPTEPLLVDIGGGDPISLLLFLDRYVNEIGKGRIVVQHRPEAIEKTKLELLQHIQHIQHIEAMPHHYFNPQPEATQGAAIYYMRQVLGTQNTTTCLQILAALVSAMREHSILIIDEKVFPDGREEPDENFVPMTELSMDMLAIFNIVTRREGIWRTMLDKAGYEIKNIHKYSPMHDYIIVAKKKQADSLPD